MSLWHLHPGVRSGAKLTVGLHTLANTTKLQELIEGQHRTDRDGLGPGHPDPPARVRR
jgi:hypothetical protein